VRGAGRRCSRVNLGTLIASGDGYFGKGCIGMDEVVRALVGWRAGSCLQQVKAQTLLSGAHPPLEPPTPTPPKDTLTQL